MKFEVIKEYDNFYLTVNKKGFKECFMKSDYKPIDGVIIKKKESNQQGNIGLPPEKVNQSFNKMFGKRKED